MAIENTEQLNDKASRVPAIGDFTYTVNAANDDEGKSTVGQFLDLINLTSPDATVAITDNGNGDFEITVSSAYNKWERLDTTQNLNLKNYILTGASTYSLPTGISDGDSVAILAPDVGDTQTIDSQGADTVGNDATLTFDIADKVLAILVYNANDTNWEVNTWLA